MAAEPRPSKVLVVDDDRAVLRAVCECLKREGFLVTGVGDPLEAANMAKDFGVDVVVSDIRMPHISGLDVLKAFKSAQPDVEVVMMTGHATIETAVEAVKAGAYHYLTKPFERIEDLTVVVKNAAERRALKSRASQLEQALEAKEQFEGLVGQSSAMRAVYELVETVAPSQSTVLIRGESGTGKELVARAIHQKSTRKDAPFVAVNCSALTETLLESELFGHMKGAFTGAIANKRGLFEAANGGTLFLDEIGDIPLATQVRLLRVLQEGEVKRVGSTDSISVDVRVVAATHVDLEEARKSGRFRDDLFYRLNVISLSLPPLRDRPEDVALLAQHFVQRHAAKLGKRVEGLTASALQTLTTYGWPGNVRELENVTERAVVLVQRSIIDEAQLPAELRAVGKPKGDAAFNSLSNLPFAEAKSLTVSAFERRYLATLLERCGQNVTQAALAAGMDRSNFRRLLKQHGIERGGD